MMPLGIIGFSRMSPASVFATWESTPELTADEAGTHTNLLVSGIRESRAWGSRRPSLSQGAPSFSPFAWAAGLPAGSGSEPEAGAVVPLRGVPFPSVVSWAPSA